jgi:hypothetical protein
VSQAARGLAGCGQTHRSGWAGTAELPTMSAESRVNARRLEGTPAIEVTKWPLFEVASMNRCRFPSSRSGWQLCSGCGRRRPEFAFTVSAHCRRSSADEAPLRTAGVKVLPTLPAPVLPAPVTVGRKTAPAGWHPHPQDGSAHHDQRFDECVHGAMIGGGLRPRWPPSRYATGKATNGSTQATPRG